MFGLTRAFKILICASRTPISPRHYAPKITPPSQALAASLRASGSNGITYASVRHQSAECAALFYPDLASEARQGRHLDYHWDGSRVDYNRDAGNGEVFRILE